MKLKRFADIKLDTVTTRIPAALNVKLKAEALLRNTTQSELVRKAIEAYLDKESEVQK